jgi:asparaginyl-tRNA synthetase
MRISEVLARGIQSDVTIRGHVKESHLMFLKVCDGYDLARIQVVFKKEQQEKVPYMSYVCVVGDVVKSTGTEQEFELAAQSVEIIGPCEARTNPLPRGKQAIPIEILRRTPELKCGTDIIAALTRIKSKALLLIHGYLDEAGFHWIQTPILTSSDCEGAGEAFAVLAPGEKKFFGGKKASLTVSGQLHVEPYALSLGRAYVFGPSFRAEKSLTRRHASEFWMLEPEVRDMDLDQMVVFIGHFMSSIWDSLLLTRHEDMAVCHSRFEHAANLTLEFTTITYTEAIDILETAGQDFDVAIEWGMDLNSDMERYLCEDYFGGKATFVTHYPAQLKSFYMYQDRDCTPGRETVACVDLLFPGIGEVIGGSQREHDFDRLKETMVARDMKLSEYEWYLRTRQYGSAPHSGFGLGFDRFLMAITGCPSIMDLMPFGARYKTLLA